MRTPRREAMKTDTDHGLRAVRCCGKARGIGIWSCSTRIWEGRRAVDVLEALSDRFIECASPSRIWVHPGGMARRGVRRSCIVCRFLSARRTADLTPVTEGTKVIYLWFWPASFRRPRHSHQSVRDISALRGVPNLSLLEPVSRQRCMHSSTTPSHRADSVYLRLVSVKWPIRSRILRITRSNGEGWVVRDGTDAVSSVTVRGPAKPTRPPRNRAERGASIRLVNLP